MHKYLVNMCIHVHFIILKQHNGLVSLGNHVEQLHFKWLSNGVPD